MPDEKHRHHFVSVSDGPGYFTSHTECDKCGFDPWVAKYNANIAKAAAKAAKAAAKQQKGK